MDSVTLLSVADELGVPLEPVLLDSGVGRDSDESLMLNITISPEGTMEHSCSTCTAGAGRGGGGKTGALEKTQRTRKLASFPVSWEKNNKLGSVYWELQKKTWGVETGNEVTPKSICGRLFCCTCRSKCTALLKVYHLRMSGKSGAQIRSRGASIPV